MLYSRLRIDGWATNETLENEILKEAVEYATEKKWIARSPLLPGDGE